MQTYSGQFIPIWWIAVSIPIWWIAVSMRHAHANDKENINSTFCSAYDICCILPPPKKKCSCHKNLRYVANTFQFCAWHMILTIAKYVSRMFQVREVWSVAHWQMRRAVVSLYNVTNLLRRKQKGKLPGYKVLRTTVSVLMRWLLASL